MIGGVPVLMYHWINEDLGDALRLYGVTPAALRVQLTWIKRLGGRSIGLDDLAGHVSGERTAPIGSVVLTFDDGYVDNVENALPILESLGMTATVFVVTDCAGAVNAWDARHGDPPRPILSWSRMRELDGGALRFEPHSRTHPSLPLVDRERARDEIVGSKKRLEDELGRRSDVFSYPHGAYDDAVEALVVEAGFCMAVTDEQGLNHPGQSPLRIRRTMVTSRDIAATYAIKLTTGRSAMDILSRA